jgi:hypothetical protein
MANAMRRARQQVSVQTTLGELIAAAFDTLGDRSSDVALLLASAELRRAAGGRILLQ